MASTSQTPDGCGLLAAAAASMLLLFAGVALWPLPLFPLFSSPFSLSLYLLRCLNVVHFARGVICLLSVCFGCAGGLHVCTCGPNRLSKAGAQLRAVARRVGRRPRKRNNSAETRKAAPGAAGPIGCLGASTIIVGKTGVDIDERERSWVQQRRSCVWRRDGRRAATPKG